MPDTKDDAHMHRKINQNEIADPKILKRTILQAFFIWRSIIEEAQELKQALMIKSQRYSISATERGELEDKVQRKYA
jgi:hypothetical protein